MWEVAHVVVNASRNRYSPGELRSGGRVTAEDAVWSMSRSREANPCMQVVARYENARRIHDRFGLARLIAGYRIRADERSWRRAAYHGRSNWPWEGIVAALFVVAIVLTGIVQTRQHWGTMQSELEAAKQAAALKKAQDLPQRLAGLNSALEDANAQRNELQTKFDQAQSELKDKQSQLEGVQSELEAAKQAAALMNTQAVEFPKKVASLTLSARGCERSTERASNQIRPGPIAAQGQAVSAGRRAERT